MLELRKRTLDVLQGILPARAGALRVLTDRDRVVGAACARIRRSESETGGAHEPRVFASREFPDSRWTGCYRPKTCQAGQSQCPRRSWRAFSSFLAGCLRVAPFRRVQFDGDQAHIMLASLGMGGDVDGAAASEGLHRSNGARSQSKEGSQNESGVHCVRVVKLVVGGHKKAHGPALQRLHRWGCRSSKAFRAMVASECGIR
jgi:hypothetical protein